jgi:mRNA export factor
VRLWEVQVQEGGQMMGNQVRWLVTPKSESTTAGGPTLCSCFSTDGNTVFVGSTDHKVYMWSYATGSTMQQVGLHDAPVRSVAFAASSNCVISGSWDKTIRFWDCRSSNSIASMPLPERVYSMSAVGDVLAVACADRKVVVFSINGQPQQQLAMDSPLKYQTRTITVFPDQSGFAIGSIEGRCHIHFFNQKPNAPSFAFRCHRDENQNTKETTVYPVNAIPFHPVYGTFATVGGDGCINFWDKDSKQRLKQFPSCGDTISCANFNAQGKIFAYAKSYEWSKGCEGYQGAGVAKNEIFLHYTVDEEIKQRKPKGRK